MLRWSIIGGKGTVVWASFRLGLGLSLVFTVIHSSSSRLTHCSALAVDLLAAFRLLVYG